MSMNQTHPDRHNDDISLNPMPDAEEAEDDHGRTSPLRLLPPSSPENTKPPSMLNRPPCPRDRHVVFSILTVMSIFFLIFNVIQIALIFELNNFYWTAVLPAALFAVFLISLGFEAYCRRAGLKESWKEVGGKSS